MTPASPEDTAMLENAVLVVAHPDDEVLWFGSILRQIGRVVIAFQEYAAEPGLGARRAAALAELPYRNLRCLGIAEAGSLRLADWTHPRPDAYGIALDAAPVDDAASARYRANYATLRSALRVELATATTVFTHNPWGEYGHEDHVQVFRAVDSLRRELGFALWCTNYGSQRSAVLAARYAATEATRLIPRRIDLEYAGSIAAVYRRHDCWTWREDWTGFSAETLVSLPLGEAAGDRRLALNMVRTDG